MKKFIIIFVLLVYSAATIGATVHLHYCMDKFVGSSFYDSSEDNECNKCGMTEKKGGCCKDEQKQIKIEDDHQKSSVGKYIQLTTTPAIITPTLSFTLATTGSTECFPASHPPPDIPKEALYIFNCVFLV